MGRILALDVGRKRTGIAISDPLKMIANGIKTVGTAEVEAFIANYTKTENLEALVIGYPKQMNNQPSEAVKYINPLINRLKKVFPEIPIHLADERFTSVLAHRAMIEGGVKKKDRQNKALADTISAAIILQSFLDYQK
ncbi:MAG: Holliday junction resolvase RuvX [Bacteroidales bacterium]|nr:Holliday junction resolvase RuvX [Bacteroidales bacterium]MBN2747927.1 Holliday junction resolvase RuvX [Bacteroidales bacterium]